MPYSIQFRFDKEAENHFFHLSEIIENTGVINLCKVHASIPHIALCVELQKAYFPTSAIIEKICITKFRPNITLFENKI